MQPKTFVLAKFIKYEFSFMAALFCYLKVQKNLPTKASIKLILLKTQLSIIKLRKFIK